MDQKEVRDFCRSLNLNDLSEQRKYGRLCAKTDTSWPLFPRFLSAQTFKEDLIFYQSNPKTGRSKLSVKNFFICDYPQYDSSSIYHTVSFNDPLRCSSVQAQLILKQSKDKLFSISMGLESTVVNEITILRYLENTPEYEIHQTRNPTWKLPFLRSVFFCSDSDYDLTKEGGVDICRIYSKYNLSFGTWRTTKPVKLTESNDILLLFDLAKSLLSFLLFLRKFRIIHLRILPDNIFFQDSSPIVTIGNWNYSHFIPRSQEPMTITDNYPLDDLSYTAILDPDFPLLEIDRLFLCITFYFGIVGTLPPFVSEWHGWQFNAQEMETDTPEMLANLPAACLAKMHDLSLPQLITLIQGWHFNQVVGIFHPGGDLIQALFQWRVAKIRSKFDSIEQQFPIAEDIDVSGVKLLLNLIGELMNPTISIEKIQQTFDQAYLNLPLVIKRSETGNVYIDPIIQQTLLIAQEATQYIRKEQFQAKLEEKILRNELFQCRQLEQIFETKIRIGLLSAEESHTLSFTARNLLTKIIPKEINRELLCEALSLFLRTPKYWLPVDNIYELIVEETQQEAILYQLDIPIDKLPLTFLELFLFACLFLAAKVILFFFLPSHSKHLLRTFIFYALTKRCESEPGCTIKNLTEISEDSVDAIVAANPELLAIITICEQKIFQSLDFTLKTAQIEAIQPQISYLCAPTTTTMKVEESISDTIKHFAATLKNKKKVLVIDLATLYPRNYNPYETYNVESIENFIKEIKTNRPFIIELLSVLESSGIPTWFVSESDFFFSLGAQLLEEKKANFTILETQYPNLTFRKLSPQQLAKQKSLWKLVWRSLYKSSTPPTVAPQVRIPLTIDLPLDRISGYLFHYLFFKILEDQTKFKRGSLLDERIISINWKPWWGLRTNAAVREEEVVQDTTSWWSAIHGAGLGFWVLDGSNEFTLQTLNELETGLKFERKKEVSKEIYTVKTRVIEGLKDVPFAEQIEVLNQWKQAAQPEKGKEKNPTQEWIHRLPPVLTYLDSIRDTDEKLEFYLLKLLEDFKLLQKQFTYHLRMIQGHEKTSNLIFLTSKDEIEVDQLARDEKKASPDFVVKYVGKGMTSSSLKQIYFEEQTTVREEKKKVTEYKSRCNMIHNIYRTRAFRV